MLYLIRFCIFNGYLTSRLGHYGVVDRPGYAPNGAVVPVPHDMNLGV